MTSARSFSHRAGSGGTAHAVHQVRRPVLVRRRDGGVVRAASRAHHRGHRSRRPGSPPLLPREGAGSGEGHVGGRSHGGEEEARAVERRPPARVNAPFDVCERGNGEGVARGLGMPGERGGC
eukprot:85715-Alexandrium_andersonii.AAC.1